MSGDELEQTIVDVLNEHEAIMRERAAARAAGKRPRPLPLSMLTIEERRARRHAADKRWEARKQRLAAAGALAVLYL